MNWIDPIPAIRITPELAPSDKKRGWGVVFATDGEGRIPALDYLENKDSASDPEFAVTPEHLNRFFGLLGHVRFEGPQGLEHRRQFEKFVGEDARLGMCEFRIVQNTGHRFMCFMREGRRLVIANGFRKPPCDETPREAKARAVAILAAHEARRRRPAIYARPR